MVRICCVKNCNSKTKKPHTKKVSFHLFPLSRPETLLKWIEFSGYGSDWKPHKHSVICSEHFERNDFKPGTSLPILKPNSVPTVCFTRDNTLIIKEKQHSKEEDPSLISSVNSECRQIQPGLGGTCRLCSQDYKSGLTSIFQPGSKYALQIFRCLKLSISPSDVLPLCLCFVCEEKLHNLEEFINCVTEAQKTLNDKYYPSSNIEFCISNGDNAAINDFQYDIKNVDLQNVDFLTTSVKKFECTNSVPNLQIQCCDVDELGVSNNIKKSISCNCLKTPNSNIQHSCIQFPINIKKPCKFADTANISYISNCNNLETSRNFIDEPNLKIPIKLEVMTPNVDVFRNPPVKSTTDKINKKIEILEDIQINPTLNKIAFKSFKSMLYDESLSNVNIGFNQRIVKKNQADILKPKISTKVSGESVTLKLLSKSKLKCRLCKKRFISKYSLNHHMNYICGPKNDKFVSLNKDKQKMEKLSTVSNAHHNVILGSNNKIKHKRKIPIIVKSEFY